MDIKTIQKRIRDLRREKNWSLHEAARRAGLDYGTVRKCELSMEKINAESLKKLADVYGVSSLYLYGYTESRAIPDQESFIKSVESIPSTGERLRFLRYNRGWTAKFVEEKAGIGRDYLYDLEAGNRVSLKTAQTLAEIYEVPVSLIYKKGVRNPKSKDGYLKTLRLKHKMTMGEVATLCGISKFTLQSYESGMARMSQKRLVQFAHFYGVSYNEMRTHMKAEHALYVEKHPKPEKQSKREKSLESDGKLKNLSHLKILRKEKKWTQAIVGEAIGVSGPMIHLYETGRISMSLEKADKLAKLFGVSADYIYGKTDERGTYVPMKNSTSENRLRLFRLLKNWTQDQAAEKSGIQKYTIGRLENGKQKLTDDLLQKFADIYQVPASAIYAPESAAVSYLDAVKMICALQEDPGLCDLVRQCLDQPENVQKCLDMLKKKKYDEIADDKPQL